MVAGLIAPTGNFFSNSTTRRGLKRGHDFERLEERTLLSATLFVTAPGVPSDATHFQTLQAALLAAQSGDTVNLQLGFQLGNFVTTALTQAAVAGASSIFTAAALDVGEVITIGGSAGDTMERALVTGVTSTGTGDYMISLATPLLLAHNGSTVDATGGLAGPTMGLAKGITLTADAGVVMPFNLEVWQTSASTTTVLSSINMGTHSLMLDGDATKVQGCTISSIVVQAGAQGNVFKNNTFNVNNGNGLSLEQAHGTVVDTNTFNVTSPAAFAVVVHNSMNVLVLGNTITTGAGGVGIFASADDTGSTSLDLRSNMIRTSGGQAIFLAKMDATASLEARVQGNDLRNNGVGVQILGDGMSAGKIDLGGGSTAFGSSTGGNNFNGGYSGISATHYAVGIFNTGMSYYVLARNNAFSGFNPLNQMADSFHDLAAGGTGVVLATGTLVLEILNLTMNTLTPVDGSVSGTLGNFTSNLSHLPADFNVVVDWGDGTSSMGVVTDNGLGGFAVAGSHTWGAPGTYTVTVIAEAMTSGNTLGSTTATVTPRTLNLTGGSSTLLAHETFNGIVANFTDSKTGTTAADYLVTIAWGDGSSSDGAVTMNANGSFSITTSRTFAAAGDVLATVTVMSKDGRVTSSTLFTMAVTPRSLLMTAQDSATLEQNTPFDDVVASFTDNKPGMTAADYTVTVKWSDGMTTAATILANDEGGFDVVTSRSFAAAGSVTATINVASKDGFASAAAAFSVTVTPVAVPRTLTMEGVDIVSDKKATFNGVVARFTDSLAGTAASTYVASIAWSDGTTTVGVVTRNGDGTFSISTSRSFTRAGIMVASVAVGTTDGAYSATASFTATITVGNDKIPRRTLRAVIKLIRHYEQTHGKGRHVCHR